MNKQQAFFEYLRTFLITIFFAFISVIILLAVIQHQIYEEQISKQVQDETIDYYLIGVLIDKNKYLETQDPQNYEINLKLGILYEVKKDYRNAEIEYEKAIAKAPYNEFKPEYRLALLYLTLNRLDDAQAVIDSLDERPNKKLIIYKANIYEYLGDKYYNSGEYEDAIERYEKALSYWKVLRNQRQIKYIKNSLASSYVYLAECYLSNMQPAYAIESLKNALLIINAPILKYKLALLLMKENPEEAYKYFEEVFIKEPEIINYDEYSKFLSTLAEKANAEGDFALAELYEYRLRKIKEYFKTNILSVEDIALEDVQAKTVSNNWLKKNNIYLNTRLKNTSNCDIGSLYLQIIFKDNNEVIGDYSKQIIDKKSILKAGSSSPLVSIRISEPQIDKPGIEHENITALIYASKTEKSYKLLLKTVEIKKEVKKKHVNKFIKWFGELFEKLTSKMPSFLF